ncbi:unnamed protein product [Caenorhabditis brenneri]
MGLVVSVVAPTVSNTISSRILLGPEKPENLPPIPSENVSKYDNLPSVISTELGPTPGNKPSPNPVHGAPIIRPPADTVSKAPDNSIYDTLDMTPEVDWKKKRMLKSPNEMKYNKT